MTATTTHYEVLGVELTASEKDISHAYRILIRQHHPDRVGPSGEEMTRTLNHAYDILSDPVKRRGYDRALLDEQAAREAPPEPAPAWSAADTSQSFKEQKPTVVVGPTKRDFALAFPPGSRSRLTGISFAVLLVAVGIVLALLAGGPGPAIWVLVSVFGGLLLLVRRPHFMAFILTAMMTLVGLAGVYWEVLTTRLGGVGLLIAGVGWVVTSLAARRWWSLRRMHKEAQEWVIVKKVSEATGAGPYLIRAVDGGMALLEDANTGMQQSLHVWGIAQTNTWVALNAAGAIVDVAPGSALESWLWVEDDRRRREAKAALIAERMGRPIPTDAGAPA